VEFETPASYFSSGWRGSKIAIAGLSKPDTLPAVRVKGAGRIRRPQPPTAADGI
jgi:hypothetical protein